MFGREYSSDEETGKRLPMLTHIFAGTREQQYNQKINRDRADKKEKKQKPPVSTKRAEHLSLKERWELAKQAMG